MKSYPLSCVLLFTLIFSCAHQGVENPNQVKLNQAAENASVDTVGPLTIVRSIIQDRNGDIWIAAFDGVFKYDGQYFEKMTEGVSSGRFFSALEDKDGNMWFGSVGDGLFRYDGQSFQQYTTKDGLVNDEILSMYEDKAGNLWFGMNGGLSRYDGTSFRNYLLKEGKIVEGLPGESVPNMQRPPDEVNAMVEDQAGNLWVATRGSTFLFKDGVFTRISPPNGTFNNIRSVISDRKGNIWLGGSSGLWKYDGTAFINISQNFVGYLHEDKDGNVWASAQRTEDNHWILARYDEATTSGNDQPTLEVDSEAANNAGMIFGILTTEERGVWFGTLSGVNIYDGNGIRGLNPQ